MSSLWSGLLRFGFTTKDPATFRNSLPKYACPDLTNSGHTYAKALPERYALKGNVLHFYVTSTGNVHFGINGEEKGIILSNVRMNGPVWALIDCYGNTNKIQSVGKFRYNSIYNIIVNLYIYYFLDSRHQLNNNGNYQINNNFHMPRLYSSVSMIDLPDILSREPSPQIYSDKCLEPIQFHRTRGCNVRLSSNKCIAERNNNYYSQGYVFSHRSLSVGEKMVVQVLKTDEIYTGSLAFGLTSCDPSHINLTDLPDDAHQLLDRPEYWVVVKDVANSPMAGDEIAFSITESGEVQMIKNRQRPVTLMHVDISQRLWPFFDLYGSTLKVRLLGTELVERCRPMSNGQRSLMATMLSPNVVQHHKSQSSIYLPTKRTTPSQYNTISANHYTKSNETSKRSNVECHYNINNKTNLYATVEKHSNQSNKLKQSSDSSNNSMNSIGKECLVCYEQPINSVLYMCGHVCMCYECSIKQWRTSGHCPICRAPIRDVIRTYWS